MRGKERKGKEGGEQVSEWVGVGENKSAMRNKRKKKGPG
jgi:hypothetical protein